MFKKKTCKRCGRKVDKEFTYCPFCGNNLDRERETRDYGFLGKEDINRTDSFSPFNEIRLPTGFNTLFRKLVREMDKQFRELDREIGRERLRENKKIGKNKSENKEKYFKKGGISINISPGAGKPVVKVRSFGNMPEFKAMEKQIKGQPGKPGRPGKPIRKKAKLPKSEISEEKARKLAKLPREEAESKVRRLSGKVVYEIELPGVKSIKDIIVNQLENSIEVKAFSKDKAYFKFLPIKLPLLDYKFSKGKLTLELGEK